MIVVLVLIAWLSFAPECHPLVVPIAVTHQTAPIDGVPILFDGAAVTVRCHF